MATELPPQSSDLYEAEFYASALEQARLLQGRRDGSLDIADLVEGAEGVPDARKGTFLDSVRSAVDHLLKRLH
jgi:hypothetical protein